MTTQDALAAASALIKGGYNKASNNPFEGVSEVSLVAAGVTDPDVRKTLVAYGRSGRGKTTVTNAGGYNRKRKGRESDLDLPLPIKAEERVAISLNFNEETEDFVDCIEFAGQSVTGADLLIVH